MCFLHRVWPRAKTADILPRPPLSPAHARPQVDSLLPAGSSQQPVAECLFERTYPTADSATFTPLIKQFLVLASAMNPDAKRPESAVLAVAGPVQNGRCEMTNIGWVLDETDLQVCLAPRAQGSRTILLLWAVTNDGGKPTHSLAGGPGDSRAAAERL